MQRPAAHLEDIDGGTVRAPLSLRPHGAAAAAGPARPSAPGSLVQPSCKKAESFVFSDTTPKKKSSFTLNISYQAH